MRVTDNTSRNAVNDAVGRTRAKIEDLQLKNATLKRINAPSDDPVGNSKVMDIRTQSTVNVQLQANANSAKDRLSHTENAVQEMTEMLMRVKEIVLNQSSGPSATEDSRYGVAQEVTQIYRQLVAVANRRVGEHFLFGGFKTLTPPYTSDGKYQGDMGEMPVEIQKGVMVTMNVPGPQVFQVKKYDPRVLQEMELAQDQAEDRSPASLRLQNQADDKEKAPGELAAAKAPRDVVDLFKTIESLRVGLLTNDTETIRGTIDAVDSLLQNSITTRSRLGARIMGIDSAMSSADRMNVQNAAISSSLEDADYAEIWASLAKEESVMRASLQAAQKLIQPTLLDFLR